MHASQMSVPWVRAKGTYLAKLALRPVLFRHAPVGLEPERLWYWNSVLMETKDVPGNVVEIGCAAGGTAAWSKRMMNNLEDGRDYWCFDTFGGFVDDQFDTDIALGTPSEIRHHFSANSVSLVRRIVDGLGCPEIRLVQADIVTMDPSLLPATISAGLVDVDLSEPVHIALRKAWARLSPGGILLVDDCGDGVWKGREGYERFVEEAGLEEEYRFEMGIARKPLSV